MDVVVARLRDVVIHDVRNSRDVDTAPNDVGRDENLRFFGAEIAHNAIATRLRIVAVNRLDGERRITRQTTRETRGDRVDAALGAAEDHHLAGLPALQEAGDDLRLVEIVRLVDELLDVRHRRLGVLAFRANVDRAVQAGARHREDRRRHRRREEHRLTGLRGLVENALHIGEEAQIEHLVRFVEDHDLHLGEIERATIG